jgi:hypothetical protein
MPSYISLQNSLIQNALLKKGILNKGILSSDIGGHFWKGKRAFPPNRQKPTEIVQILGFFLAQQNPHNCGLQDLIRGGGLFVSPNA